MTYYLCLFREALSSNNFNATVIREEPEKHFHEMRDWILVETFDSAAEINESFSKQNGQTEENN